MTAAFVLGINMVIAGIFAIAFGVVAATNRSARGALWMASGYATGIVDVALEFLLRIQSNPTPVGIGIFLTFLLALTLCLIGVARHYDVAPPWKAIAAIWVLSLLAVPLLFAMPVTSVLRRALYQLPYIATQLLFGFVVLRSGRRQALDLLLIGLAVLSALLYAVKPLIAWTVGAASTPQAYMASTYAAISQSIGAVTLVALALVLLLVMMRDTTAEMLVRSETDSLSGLLNRRGFDRHAERRIERALRTGAPAVLIAADLDHFKAINDGYGHAAGDGVIAHFADVLRHAVAEGAVVSRLGGEEFAVLLAGADLAEGRRQAEAARRAFRAASFAGLGIDGTISASFGVAQAMAGDTLFDLSRRADAALYRAKAGGRNRVCVALGELPPTPTPMGVRKLSG
ncbi:GGDEF domain-containing protein [Sphingopyxis sp. GW247-27LB]|uniref:GGDEF domain-containing protein n=1 Tax=Sphingopyxis sp. GW247-27LB TaxID=2012632 RepID=UPI000BA50D4D|nr:GGDEF domain-containing protein [Sphingopyxis sp. GW247-27LB]PAL25008.1 GGDEF domain-containing protein [Sphingopyxis sp. GW247-27LB]